MLLNYRGALSKENKEGKQTKYYLFYGIDEFEDLAQYSNNMLIKNETPD